MMKTMQEGDLVLFYHSNAEPSGVVGLGRIETPAVPDPTQFIKKSEYYDEKATQESPRWFCVRVHFKKKAKRELSLAEIKSDSVLRKMLVALPGQRLSIMPVEAAHAELILSRCF
jgi:predicted RNA-binding protein with PUA-like domain